MVETFMIVNLFYLHPFLAKYKLQMRGLNAQYNNNYLTNSIILWQLVRCSYIYSIYSIRLYASGVLATLCLPK